MTESDTIIFHFYSSKWYLPFGLLIKAKSNSMYDHVAIEVPNEGFFQANFAKGVIDEKKNKTDPIVSISLPFDRKSKRGKQYIEFLKAQVGKGYDYKAILFGFWGFKCESYDRWYCSELADSFFSFYLKKDSVVKTTISPKVFLVKIEAFLSGYNYEK